MGFFVPEGQALPDMPLPCISLAYSVARFLTDPWLVRTRLMLSSVLRCTLSIPARWRAPWRVVGRGLRAGRGPPRVKPNTYRSSPSCHDCRRGVGSNRSITVGPAKGITLIRRFQQFGG